MAVDSSTTNCGVAIFIGGNLTFVKNYTFKKGSYDLVKLIDIITEFEHLFVEVSPDLVVLEEPTPFKENTRSITSLNQVAGAILACAYLRGANISFAHNRTVRSFFKFPRKVDKAFVIEFVKSRYPTLGNITDHEADAILVGEYSFNHLVDDA